jgi:hypothetical protein
MEPRRHAPASCSRPEKPRRGRLTATPPSPASTNIPNCSNTVGQRLADRESCKLTIAGSGQFQKHGDLFHSGACKSENGDLGENSPMDRECKGPDHFAPPFPRQSRRHQRPAGTGHRQSRPIPRRSAGPTDQVASFRRFILGIGNDQQCKYLSTPTGGLANLAPPLQPAQGSAH